MTHRVSAMLWLAAIAATATPAQAQQYRQRLDTTFAFSDGMVDVRSISGPVTITTWNRKEVKIAAFVERGELVAELSGTRVRLEAREMRDGGRRRSMGEQEFVLTVPAGTRVDAHAVSGDVSVRGTKSDVSAESVSGDVEVDDADGRVEVSSVSGDVKAKRLNGTVSVTSVSGDVRIREMSGSLTAESVSGSVDIADTKATSVKAETVSGDVAYRGTLDPRGRYAMQSHSGDVTMMIPENSKADISTKTFSGSIESEFPLVTGGVGEDTPRKRRDRMRFTLGGGGGATVDLETFSGSLILRRPGAKTSRED